MALNNDSFPSFLCRGQWRENAFQWLREKRQYNDFDLDSCLKILEKNPLIREAALAAFWGAYLANEVPPVLSALQLQRIRKVLDYGSPPDSQAEDIKYFAFVKLHLAGLLAISLIRPDQPIVESHSAVVALETALVAYKLGEQPAMDTIIDDPSVWGNQYFYKDLFVFSLVLVGGIAQVELSFWHADQRNYADAFSLITNGAWGIHAATVEDEPSELPDFKPYLPHSGNQFNIQEVADIFEEVKRHSREIKDWWYVKIGCEAIQYLGAYDLYDSLLDGVKDANGDEFGAAEYWGKAVTFVEDQMRIVASPIPIVTRDMIERTETKERLKRDFFDDLWEELEERAQEILVDTEIQWMHYRPDNMVKEIRPMLELELPSIFLFLQPTIGQSDSRLILTRMKDSLLTNKVVRASIDGLKIDSHERKWAKDELPGFLQKVIEVRNYFDKERHLSSKGSSRYREMSEKAVSIHRELLGIGCEGVLPRLMKIKVSTRSKR